MDKTDPGALKPGQRACVRDEDAGQHAGEITSSYPPFEVTVTGAQRKQLLSAHDSGLAVEELARQVVHRGSLVDLSSVGGSAALPVHTTVVRLACAGDPALGPDRR